MADTLLPPQQSSGEDVPATDVPVIDISAVNFSGTPTLGLMRAARLLGPAFALRVDGQDNLFVSSLDLVTELADDQRFTKNIGLGVANLRPILGDGLFTAHIDEPNWAKAHDILMPAFGLGSMRTYHPVMLKVAHRLIESWDRRAATGSPVEVADDMTRMTLDTIGLAGFDFDFGSFDRDEPHPFVSSMLRCLDWAMTSVGRTAGVDFSEQDEAMRVDAAYLASVVDEVIAARTTAPTVARTTAPDTAPGKPQDLLGLMLTATHPSDGATLDLENVRKQIITFLIAGHETTSGALAFALYYLAKNPAVLRLAQREVDEMWGDTPAPEPTFEDVGRLGYLRQVLNEALRLWPTAPGFAREARQDTVLGGRIPLRAGQSVRALIPMLHREPVWGDNPELFDPSRFAPDAVAARSPHAFKPFGTGERACIGRQFALHEATMVLAMLLHRYRLIDHADYELKLKQSLTIKPDGFTLTLAPRTAADRAANRAALPTASAAQPDRGPAEVADLPTRVRQGTGLLLLHGSNYGTCRDFATGLAEAAAELGCDTTVAPLDAHRGALPTDRPVVIVTASYNGQPTDDAAAFVSWLREAEAEAGAAEGVSYAVLGVGDRNWSATYQRIPTLVDDRLAALGATRILDRAEADASGDLTGSVEAFTAALRTALLERYGDPATVGAGPQRRQDGPAYTVTEVTGSALDTLAARHGMTPMTVVGTAGLTHPQYPRVKRLVRLALPEGTSYRTADHLTVLPANDSALVERAAHLLRADLDTVLSIVPNHPRRDGIPVAGQLTIRQLLTRHVELQDRPTVAQLAVLAALNPCPPERAALGALAENADAHAADQRTLLDLIEDHPALRESLSWPALLELLPPIRPRHYSVSSSPTADPHQVDLMVSVLEAPARSGRGTFRGTGSGYLNSVRPGDTLLARIQPCREAFRVGHDADTPVIMIAAGTGLAPFRAAIAERRALALGGTPLAPALCYFGCDAPDADYLHADELRAAEQAGAVSLRPAFSKTPVDGRRFVQDRITAEADEVWELLNEGARVHVCGDGARMAPGVRNAFQAIYLRQTRSADRAEAQRWLQTLMDQSRYVEDVFSG
ncbi:cytochrome P450/NADPH-cytochrome P450 reductase [Kitasatospora sp. GAS204A]|uniref:bifunctional cytochrome P450/NADPH--P450 reductase n=1 Tax=unclassified Kitasatospora TaxID=2633591 RepID=UPI0024732FA7|nr:cytochrome P450 [Kitasatospora sp. GAS204B]MDH6120846.1 cytochrome P450/NADPH-cytochrome P450 reductase [Kitasatospora sp. GAS204B]